MARMLCAPGVVLTVTEVNRFGQIVREERAEFSNGGKRAASLFKDACRQSSSIMRKNGSIAKAVKDAHHEARRRKEAD